MMLQMNLTSHGMDITPALRTFAEEKLSKLERHFSHIMSLDVRLEVEKLRQIAKAKVLLSKAEIVASAESEDMYTAIDLLIDKLDEQLIRHKEKIQDHHRE